MDNSIRFHFNNFIHKDDQKRLRDFFDGLNTEDGIMLQSYFEDFAKSILKESQKAEGD